jgi:hypothetical protein
MNEWAQRRKRIILSLIFGTLIILVGLPVFFFFYRSPSCSDGRKNGDETGIDCGGTCQKLCPADTLPIISKGDAQVFKVGSTTFAVAVQAENPNINSEILRAQYLFKIYEASSTVPIKLIEGDTYVPKAGKFAVFEGPFELGESMPTRATFEWKEKSIIWNTNRNPLPALVVEDKFLINEDSEPRLTAEIYNQGLDKVSNIELTAIISDQMGNMIGASKTFIDSLEKDERQPAIFTWPQSFSGTPGVIEVLIKILPDKSFL